MRVQMQECDVEAQLVCNHWDLGIVGKQIDDRGRGAVDFVKRHVNETTLIDYDPERFELTIDGTTINSENIESFLQPHIGKSIILESTTLGFVELFLCCKALFSMGFPRLSFVYVEPGSYALRVSSTRRSVILNKRDFELSDEVVGYRAIPGALRMLSDRFPQRSVFFLGYEERRLERALEDHQMMKSDHCSVVFGVPAFRPGWEMDAFANNVRILKEKRISGGVYFCGAENPASAIQVLETIHNELGANERFFVAPIGTKPNGIGVALFAATRSDVGLLYDHPKRRRDRSREISRWHLYDVTF